MALNVELLESSFAQIKVNSSEVTKQFYTVLFTDYPEVQPLFANTNMEKQRKQLFHEKLGHSTRLVRCIAATLPNGGQ